MFSVSGVRLSHGEGKGVPSLPLWWWRRGVRGAHGITLCLPPLIRTVILIRNGSYVLLSVQPLKSQCALYKHLWATHLRKIGKHLTRFQNHPDILIEVLRHVNIYILQTFCPLFVRLSHNGIHYAGHTKAVKNEKNPPILLVW